MYMKFSKKSPFGQKGKFGPIWPKIIKTHLRISKDFFWISNHIGAS